MRRVIISSVILLIILFVGWTSLNFSEFIKPKLLGVTNIEVIEINKDTVSINVEVSLINNFFLNVDINEIKVNIFSGEDTIGAVNSVLKTSLPGNDTSKLNLPADFHTAKLAKLLEENSDSIKIKLKGLIDVKILFFNKDIEIDEDLNIALKSSLLKAIEKVSSNEETAQQIIEIKSAKLIDVGLKNSKVLIEFTLKNPYNVPITLISYPADIYINDNYAGKGNLKKEIVLQEIGEITKGEFEFDVENIRGIKSLIKTIFTTKMTYKTIGNLHLTVLGYIIKIPYSTSGDLIKL